MQPEKFVVYALEALKQGEHCWVVDFRVPDMTITLLVTIQWLHWSWRAVCRWCMPVPFCATSWCLAQARLKTAVVTDQKGQFFVAVLWFLVSCKLLRMGLLELVELLWPVLVNLLCWWTQGSPSVQARLTVWVMYIGSKVPGSINSPWCCFSYHSSTCRVSVAPSASQCSAAALSEWLV